MAQSLETIHRVVTVAEERGLTALIGKMRELGIAHEGVAVATEKTAKQVENADRRLESFQRRADPLHRDARQLERDMRDVDAAFAASRISIEDYDRLLGMAADRTKSAQQTFAQAAVQMRRDAEAFDRAMAEQARNEEARAAQAAELAQKRINRRLGVDITPIDEREQRALLSALAAQGQAFEEAERQKREEDEETARQRLANETLVDKELARYAKLRQARAAENAAYEDRIERARVAQQGANLRAEFEQRVGITQAPATTAGATTSAFADQAKAEAEALRVASGLQQAAAATAKQHADAIAGVTQALDDQLARLTLSNRDYELMTALRRADVSAASAEGQAIASRINMLYREREAREAANKASIQSQSQIQQAAAAAGQAAAQEARSLNELLQRINPIAQATKLYNAQLERNLQLKQQGVLVGENFNKANQRAKADLDQITKGSGLATNGLQNLSFQINDIATGLLSGQSPFTIIVQQGGQVYQALSGPRGIGAGIQEAGKHLLNLAFSAKGAAVAVLAVAVGAFAAWNDWNNQQLRVSATLKGVGQQAGLTKKQFDDMAAAAAQAGNLSVRTATEMADALIRANPRLSAETMKALVASTKDFAANFTRNDIPEAQKQINDLVAQGGDAVLEFDKRWNILDIHQRDALKTAIARNDQNKIYGLLLDGLKTKTATWEESTGVLEKAWDRIKLALAAIRDAFGPWIEKMASIITRFLEVAARGATDLVKGDFSQNPVVSPSTARGRDLSGYGTAFGGGEPDPISPASRRQIDDNAQYMQATEKATEKLKNMAKEMEGARKKSEELSQGLTGLGADVQKNLAQEAEKASEAFDEQTKALEGNRRELESYLKTTTSTTEQEKYRAQLEETNKAIGSTNVAERERAINLEAMKRKEQEATEAAEKAAATEKASAEAKRELLKVTQDRIEAQIPEIKQEKEVSDRQEALNKARKEGAAGLNGLSEAESRNKQLIESTHTATGKRLTQEDLAAEKDRNAIKNIQARTQEERVAAAQDEVRASNRGRDITVQQNLNDITAAGTRIREEDNQKLRDNLRDIGFANELLALEAKMLFATDDARQIAIAGLKKEQELRSTLGAGAETNPLAKRVIEQTEAQKKLELQGKANERIFNEIKDAGVSAFTSLAQAIASGVKPLEAMHSAIKQIGNALISGGIKNVAQGNVVAGGIEAAVGFGLSLFEGNREASKAKRQKQIDALKQQMEDQARAVQEAQELIGNYLDRLARSTTDTNTLAGSLKIAELDAQKLRAEASKAGGQALVLAEQIIAVDRKKIMDDFAEQAIAKEEEIGKRRLSYEDRIFAAANDNQTLAGQLAAFDRAAAQERLDEVQAGGEALASLEEAQYAERSKIVRDYTDDAIAEEKRRFDEARDFLDQFAKTIKQFVDQLRTGTGSPLSPQARLALAQEQYNAQLALAQAGDRDALSGITNYATNVLDASKAFYGSTLAFQSIFDTITGQLTGLPEQVTPETLIVNAINNQTSTLATILNSIDTNGDGMIDRQEAGNTFLGSIFDEIDVNGDDQLTQLELANFFGQEVSTGVDTTIGQNDASNASLDAANMALATANATLVTEQGILAAISTNTAQLAVMQQQLQDLFNTTSKTSNNAARTASNTQISAAYDSNNLGVGYVGDFTYARGGWARGPGTSTSDSINARLSNGEYVVRADMASVYGPMLERMNAGLSLLPSFAAPAANDNSGALAALSHEVSALRAELSALRGDVQQGTRVAVAGHQTVREGIDVVAGSQQDMAREAALQGSRAA